MYNETEIIDGIKRGDPEIFREFVESRQKQVISTCFGFTQNIEDSRDLAQEVFIEVYNSIHKFRGDSLLSTWLYRIAVNKSLNHVKRAKRNKWMSLSMFFAEDNASDINTAIAQRAIQATDNIENNERRLILQKAISSLPENQKIAFTLHNINDISYQNIADIMSLSLSAVESLIHRAKKNLQKKLVNYYKDKL